MAKLYNLARMTTATTSTGTITLGSAVSGYLTFALAGVANGDIVSYGIKDGANSEIGIGTYTTSGTTLTRTVTKSTNSNAAINLSGTAEVFITPRAEDFKIFPTTQTLTSGTSATYTPTAPNAVWIEVFMVGGGAGGHGVSSSINVFVVGSNGTASSFNSVVANPGLAASGTSAGTMGPALGGTGGTGTATRRAPGTPGLGPGFSSSAAQAGGGAGGGTYFSGGTPPIGTTNGNGNNGATNTGAGGSSGCDQVTNFQTGMGGGGGEFVYLILPATTYTYTVGPGGAGGSSTRTGGSGAAGQIFIIEHYGN